MRLDPLSFNKFLSGIGQRVLWQQSFICPCIQDHSGAADTACPICKGKGRTWNAPVDGVVGVTAQGVDAKIQDFGAMELGDITLTVPSDSPLYNLGRFDRVTLLNSTDVFSRVLTRIPGDNLSDLSVQSITRVFWRSPDKRSIIDGSLPVVSANGTLVWGDGGPDFGVQYSVTGIKFDTYFVWQSLPSDRNEHQGAPLPRRVQARKWDLYSR